MRTLRISTSIAGKKKIGKAALNCVARADYMANKLERREASCFALLGAVSRISGGAIQFETVWRTRYLMKRIFVSVV